MNEDEAKKNRAIRVFLIWLAIMAASGLLGWLLFGID